ncbi:hypothetical protein BH09MYX1_BH09MYX1_28400 [soil metagenome]
MRSRTTILVTSFLTTAFALAPGLAGATNYYSYECVATYNS